VQVLKPTVMRRLLFILSAVLCSTVCLAQPQFGIKGGVDINHLHSEGNANVVNTSFNVGYTFGVTLDLKASEQFTVQPEFNYLHLEALNDISQEKWKYNYLTLPVLLKYRFKDIGFGMYAGPQLGFVVNASSHLNGKKTDIKELTTKNDFAAVAGLDYRFENNFRIDFRYQYSFFNTLKTVASDNYKNQNRVFSVTIGYVFNCSKKS
jgi:opacity protein-like surface antigen